MVAPADVVTDRGVLLTVAAVVGPVQREVLQLEHSQSMRFNHSFSLGQRARNRLQKWQGLHPKFPVTDLVVQLATV
ncbi:hypothetical protein ACTD5D_21960 [Nocardia takedensis]|uniref:hypothetical protein n=1 Tax=Nocardia takedensis TaxID=259390 RepID=UPI003F76803C